VYSVVQLKNNAVHKTVQSSPYYSAVQFSSVQFVKKKNSLVQFVWTVFQFSAVRTNLFWVQCSF